jgi:hypothetical protein
MIFSLVQLALFALGLAAALVLFLSVQREMYIQARINRVRWDEVLDHLSRTEPANPVSEPPAPASTPLSPLSGMNLNTRIQALRLLRRGEDVSHVAAAFGLPRSEVELLVRVHQLGVKRAAQGGSS